MSDEKATSQAFKFRPRQSLGPPRTIAPPRAGSVSATVQFVILGFNFPESERSNFLNIATRCGLPVYDAKTERVRSQDGQESTLVSIAFYVPEPAANQSHKAAVDETSVLLVERFMGTLSFHAGMKCLAVATQTSIIGEGGQVSTLMEPSGRAGGDRVSFRLPEEPFGGRTPSDNIFSALFWLRRGLAEKDPIETYSALMVCLQTIAREVVGPVRTEQRCSGCGTTLFKEPSVTASVRELVVNRLGASPELFSRLWKERNAVVAHGNETVAAETFLQLTELKFDAAKLCFAGVKLALGMPAEQPPWPERGFFVTSALMYLD